MGVGVLWCSGKTLGSASNNVWVALPYSYMPVNNQISYAHKGV